MKNTLTYKDYIGTVEFDAENDLFFGTIHGIHDLVNFEGTSVQELKLAFEEAVDDYLETCATLGRAPNKTYKGSFNIRVSIELHRKSALIAAEKKVTLNDFVKWALSYAIEHESEFQRSVS
ncbi:MAG: type II toxin-antitoxin system HicB family antitoxin [Bacteroidota bacterium]